MNEYTYQQKIAMMHILLDIIQADGIIDERETFFFNKLKDDFHLTDEDYDNVKSKNSLLALTQIKLLSDEQKKHFAQLMAQMITIDDDINVNEVAIFNIVSEVCAINKNLEDAISAEEISHCTKS